MVTHPPEKIRRSARASVLAVSVPFHYAGRSRNRWRFFHMGHRLSKIVTRTGDAGTTGLGDGSRVAKDSQRIESIGAVDELNSTLGLLLSEILPDDCASVLIDVQHDLFDLGGELSIPGYVAVTDAHVLRLEER